MAEAISFLSNPYTVVALGTAAVSSAYWVLSNLNMPVIKPSVDIQRQSIELPVSMEVLLSSVTLFQYHISTHKQVLIAIVPMVYSGEGGTLEQQNKNILL